MKHLVIGGTGTLGQELIRRLAPKYEVTCFSRDELKQQEMRRELGRVRYVIGDIRDRESLARAMVDVETVFHVAALKHVDVIEDNPSEAIKTNVLGTINVAEAALAAGVRHVVFSSTDKAVLPINVYGMTKGLAERYLLGLNRVQDATKFSVYRWGNVAGSRGSVIHAFARSLQEERVARVTDARMTRFWIHIADAVEFMLETYRMAAADRAMIPHMRAYGVVDLVQALADVLGVKKFTVMFSGLRAGEKIHETLESNHDFCVRSDTAEMFTKNDIRELLRRAIG